MSPGLGSWTVAWIRVAELWIGADLCLSGMTFVRGKGGLSHCEEEESYPEDIEAGVNVVLGTAMRLAEVS